ncbi:interferon gamma receptor 1-like [Garra rufa]|uniref:interferon gamma receptor 1-like n=1 Tax=Garra rufa TaxID=137080 RepID=UPI003CCE9C03
MTMSKDPVVQFGVFYALLFPVLGSVPSPTNISVVCHNFVNVLYWNYSNPTEQLIFSVNVDPYESDPQTVDTSQTYLDISSYSRDGGDDYFVSVTAHDGQEKSESVFIRFTYSKDFFDANKHKYKCSLDFPAINTSVHKDVIEASFQHPFLLHQQNILKQEFMYTVTHDEQNIVYSCFEDEELCTAKIHLNQSAAGQCVELKFEGKIAGIPSYTYINVCVPQQTPETDKTRLIAVLLGGGTIMLFIIMGVVWLICRNFSDSFRISITPQGLRSIIPGQSFTIQPELTDVSSMTSQGPLLEDVSSTDIDCKANSTLPTSDGKVMDLSEEVSHGDVTNDNNNEDITDEYEPRPPVH